MAIIETRGTSYRARIRRNGAPALSRTFSTYGDAQAWATETEAAIRAGRLADVLDRQATLGQQLDAYRLAVLPKQKGALAADGRARALLRDPLAAYNVENLCPAVIAAFVERRQREGATGSTINRQLSLLSACIKWSRAKRGCNWRTDLFIGQRQPENAARTRRVEGDELQRILAVSPPSLRAFIELGVASAMRRGEMVALRWIDIDLKKQVARLHDTKNGSARLVPLSPRGVEMLKSLPRPIDSGARVFSETADWFSHAFIKACKAAGVTGLRLHDLRAEAISRAADAGCSLAELKMVGGHKTPAMLFRYMRTSEDAVAALAQKLG